MLALKLSTKEQILIDKDIILTFYKDEAGHWKIGIQAPINVRITRIKKESYDRER